MAATSFVNQGGVYYNLDRLVKAQLRGDDLEAWFTGLSSSVLLTGPAARRARKRIGGDATPPATAGQRSKLSVLQASKDKRA